tara:strand:- start:3757 stop:3936 length:180 start_codon:yes stop_codon:yes gene_type:complete
MIDTYTYISILCMSLVGVLILVKFLLELAKDHCEKKEEAGKKKLRDACIGKDKFNGEGK